MISARRSFAVTVDHLLPLALAENSLNIIACNDVLFSKSVLVHKALNKLLIGYKIFVL